VRSQFQRAGSRPTLSSESSIPSAELAHLVVPVSRDGIAAVGAGRPGGRQPAACGCRFCEFCSINLTFKTQCCRMRGPQYGSAEGPGVFWPNNGAYSSDAVTANSDIYRGKARSDPRSAHHHPGDVVASSFSIRTVACTSERSSELCSETACMRVLHGDRS
jgi:hypothetical protein